MAIRNQADGLRLFDFHTPAMRAFHCTWIAFFTSFFAWFGLAPLMPIIRQEMDLQPWQVGNLIMASVSATILARLVVGPMCDRFGPRRMYCWLLCLCSFPVMGVGLAESYEALLVFRFLIGAIGASFVITQFHTSTMFSKRCVGAANAAAAGWGNLGGGVTQLVMPLAVGGLMALGLTSFWAWRSAMFVAGLACLGVGIGYYLLTQDAPDGDFKQLRAAGLLPRRKTELAGFWAACRNPYAWALFVVYGACFGLELTMDNVAAVYFFDRFHLTPQIAGGIAATFGAMNLFARFLGGWIADRFGSYGGLRARIGWLSAVLLGEGISLMWFGGMNQVTLAIAMLLVVGLFVKMSNGATYAVVPLVHRGQLGAVAGIVGAGGNVGAVAAGYLFRAPTAEWPAVLETIGVAVALIAVIPLALTILSRPDTTPAVDAVVLEPA